MRMYDIIYKKRKGEELTDEEIAFFVQGYTDGDVKDYQASALTMAICFQGMTRRETATLTKCMAHSGDTVNLSRFGDMSVDKHSTGGVGDKTSLIVGPIVASLGGKLAKMSGRGLGHTGGTVDKLEAITGFKTSLSEQEFLEQVEKVGLAIIGQTGNLTPADKKLYALRDVTATVDSIPLIVSSIMSKKIAAGSHSIVLDVKVGSGGFMKTVEDAEILAQNMVDIGKSCGRNMAALLTDMDCPLGSNVGNALEVIEAVQVLKGEKTGDLRDVCVELASAMVSLVYGIDSKEAHARVEDAITSGKAFAKMKEWVGAQGGDISLLEDTGTFPKTKYALDVVCEKDGYITQMDAEGIGIASVMLGAGRATKDDDIDYAAGIILAKKTGDKVCKGDVLCTLYTNKQGSEIGAAQRYLESITIGDTHVARKPLVYKIVR